MDIRVNQIASVKKSFSDAIDEGKKWLAVDQAIEHLSLADLHFFKFQKDAEDFQEFNAFQYKDILLVPTKDAFYDIKESIRSQIEDDPETKIISVFFEYLVDHNLLKNETRQLNELAQELDKYKWKVVSYEPGKKKFASFDEKVTYNRLEWLIEQLSALAQGKFQKEDIRWLLQDRWRNAPMYEHITPVLEGQYGKKAQSLINNKLETMNAENLEYLQKQMLYSGFGEGLNTQLERKIKEGLPDFQLNASHEFGKDKMDAVLYFSRSKQDGSDKYFFNKYDATLNNAHGDFQQTFFINNKGQSITFKEACNLLNGRSVYKELTPKEGARYKAWVKLDFNNRDEHGNAKLNIFNEKYGFSLKEALGRIPLQELKDPEKMATLFTTLEGGNMAKGTLIKSDREIEVQLAADPKFKTVKMFDIEGVKLYVPAAKMEKQYGQAPVDEKRAEQGQAMEVGQPLGDAKSQNDRPLLEKKKVNRGKGHKIA
jgi:hypothetical protein